MQSPHVQILKQALTSEELSLFAYLYGSSVDGEITPLSDVDIAVYPVRKLNLDDRLGIIQRLGKKTRLDKLDITFLDPLKNLYILETIIDRGLLLVDKNPDVRELFEVMSHHRYLDFQYQRKLYMGET